MGEPRSYFDWKDNYIKEEEKRIEALKTATTVKRKIKVDWQNEFYDIPVYVEEVRILYKNALPDHLYKTLKSKMEFSAILIKYIALSKSYKTKNVNFVAITDNGYIERQDPYDDVEINDIIDCLLPSFNSMQETFRSYVHSMQY